jgi:hypothetical protein
MNKGFRAHSEMVINMPIAHMYIGLTGFKWTFTKNLRQKSFRSKQFCSMYCSIRYAYLILYKDFLQTFLRARVHMLTTPVLKSFILYF